MPLFLHELITGEGEIGIWEIEESEEWFTDRVHLWPSEQDQLEQIKGRKRVEWLAVRHLVHHMSGREVRGAFFKDEFGKPHLEQSDFDISISHSGKMAAAIAAPEKVGIDIQGLVGKIERIAHRYMRPVEIESLGAKNRLEHLHVYWGAKEALYKAYGRRKLDFCKNIIVTPFQYDLDKGHCIGTIEKEAYWEEYDIRYQKIGGYILVYCVERKKKK